MEDLLNEFIPQPVTASVGRRWLGAVVDHIILWVLYFILIYTLGTGTIDEDGDHVQRVEGGWGFFVIVLPWFFLLPGVEAINRGQTLGKAIVGVRTVKMNGEKPGFGRTLVRHLFDMVDYFPFLGIVGMIVASNTDNRQRVGDLVAQTMVVNAR